MKLFLIFLASISLWADNKIVYIISAPRSLSTASLRMFANRDDFKAFIDSSCPIYFKKHYPEEYSSLFIENPYQSIDEIKKDFIEANKDSHIVVKDMSYSAHDFLVNDQEFVQNPNLHFIFLIRNPYDIQLSIYKKEHDVSGPYCDVVGTKKLYNIYQAVKEQNPNKIHLLFVDEFSKNPRPYLEEILEDINLPFTEKSVSWESIDKNTLMKQWHQKSKPFVSELWYDVALQSTHIMPLTTYPQPLSDDDLFKDVESDSDREELIKAYIYNLPYYMKFLEEKK